MSNTVEKTLLSRLKVSHSYIKSLENTLRLVSKIAILFSCTTLILFVYIAWKGI